MSDGTNDDGKPNVRSSAPRIPKKAATFPPTRWDKQQVVSKTTPPASLPPTQQMPVAVPTPRVQDDLPTPPTEAEAREFITVRFRAAGYQPTPDCAFQAPGLACVLDGFDAAQRTGFVYVSHEDADVVSDIGHAEELAFKSLYDMNDAFIMVVHDQNVDSLSTLEFRVDEFLRDVHRRRNK